MEDKTVVLSVLIMSLLIIAQIQVEAQSQQSCCPDTRSRDINNRCRVNMRLPRRVCARLSGCILVDGPACPDGYKNDILENSGDVVHEYCKLGCTSSVCGALTTLQKSDASETVNGAVAQCTKACSNFCTKGSVNNAVGTA